MTTGQLGTVIRYLRTLADPPARDRTDAQLLERFRTQRDQAAFTALVQRHGRLVWGVCRHILHDDHDAEDAFQTTFLVLVRQAATVHKPEALASWLHGVAYRVAMRAKRDAARRRTHERQAKTATHAPGSPPQTSEIAWRELQAILDEEVQALPDRLRVPFVLCCLEGRSQADVAAQLGWKLGTVSSSVNRARKALQRRLVCRGVSLSAVLCAATLSQEAAGAAVPVALAQTTIQAALALAANPAAAVVPAHIAAWMKGITQTMFLSKVKIATTLLAAAAVVTVGGLTAYETPAAKQPVANQKDAGKATVRPSQPEQVNKGQADETFTCRGRVLDPVGKPLAGTKLYLSFPWERKEMPSARATTGNDGRFEFTAARKEFVTAQIPADVDIFSFLPVVAVAKGYGPDWTLVGKRPDGELTLRLVKNDVTINGRILDLQGKAVAGAKIQVVRLETTAEDDLAPFLKALRLHSGGQVAAIGELTKILHDPALVDLPKTVTTDANGRFRLPGAGNDRIVVLSVEAPQIEQATIRVLPRTAQEVKALVKASSESMMLRGQLVPFIMYGTDFDHLGLPTRMIVGVVRDQETGKPMAGVRINGHPEGRPGESRVEAITDAQGRYQLRGLSKADRYELFAWPGDFSVYIPGGKEVTGGEGLATVEADFEMIRGVEIRGRVTDKVTGKPVRAGVRYVPLRGNRHPGAAYFRMVAKNCEGPSIGTFREMVPPGPGVFLATVRVTDGDNPYTQVRLEPAERAKTGLNEFELLGANGYCLIDAAADAKSLTCSIQVDPGRSVTGTVLGPDGQPLTGALVRGLTALQGRPNPTTLKTASFTVVGLDARESRQVLFVHPDRKLAGELVIRENEKDAVKVQLEPWAAVAGRLLDEEGQPLAGARIQIMIPHAIYFLPATWWVFPQGGEVKTDRDGRFRVEGLTPGMKFRLSVSRDNKFLPLADTANGMRELSVHAGENKDLGDLKTKPN